jgi:predicted lipoprotein with Yx(FWY)xxD motif
MRYPLALIVVLAGLVFAACGDDDEDPTTPATTAESAAQEEEPKKQEREEAAARAERERPGTEIVVDESQYGPMLFNAEQQAIYLFDKEASGAAECYGECAAAWPPVLTEGDPQAGSGTDGKLLGTTERDDGSTQVTYNGHPLYYYAHEGPGQVLCHDIAEFGGLWLVVQPNGEAAPA